jgi:uncharacterized Zn-finger protein
VSAEDLPLCCPMPQMYLWNSHPRVYLPIETSGWAKCPYCSAEYTLRHVSRGARFLQRYVASIGMPDLAPVAARIIHFTGYEIPVQRIEVPGPLFRNLGNMLGTADIIAQMADRCYLEKCRDRLYPEFVLGGLASMGADAGTNPSALFDSPEDLLRKTPGFYRTANVRLTDQLGAAYDFVKDHFGGQNPYLEEVAKNIRYAERVAETGDLTLLRRVPPPRQMHQAAQSVAQQALQTVSDDRAVAVCPR